MNMIKPLDFHATCELQNVEITHMWDLIDSMESLVDNRIFIVKDHVWFPLCRTVSDPNDLIRNSIKWQ